MLQKARQSPTVHKQFELNTNIRRPQSAFQSEQFMPQKARRRSLAHSSQQFGLKTITFVSQIYSIPN